MKVKHPKIGIEFALVSKRNRIFKDKKKEDSKIKCRRNDDWKRCSGVPISFKKD